MAAARTASPLHGGLLPFAATFFNFVDYLQAGVAPGVPQRIHTIYVFTHDSVFLGEDGPTHEPIEQLATLRATPNCDVVRPADSLEIARSVEARRRREGRAVRARADAPEVAVSGRARRRRRARARTCSPTPRRTPRSHSDRDRFRSLARRRCEENPRRQGHAHARRLDAVLGALRRAAASLSRRGAAARRRARACRSRPARRWAGRATSAIAALPSASTSFGTSAPAAAIAKAYGFTPENVADLALEKFALAAR